MARYFEEASVEDLFAIGACSFRMDPASASVAVEVLKGAEWYMPELPDDVAPPEFHSEKPIARLSDEEQLTISKTLQGMVDDEVLMRGFQNFGAFEVNRVEAFNGAFDEEWHHDGLAGKRGHAGNFFMLCYLSLTGGSEWDPAWGGAFDIGERSLHGNWVHEIDAPEEFVSILPKPRTCILGWNGHPRLVHRSAPLRAQVDRVVIAASLRLRSSVAR